MLIRQGRENKISYSERSTFFLLIIKNLFETRFWRNRRGFKSKTKSECESYTYVYSYTIGGWELRVGSMLKFNGDDKFKKKIHDNWTYIL